MPKVLNAREAGRRREGAVYVGRPSVWGNPFVIRRESERARAIARYEAWLAQRPDLVARARRDLRGKDLICWCAPRPCHAEVLLRIANEP